MEFHEVLARRRMVRAYDQRPVDHAALSRLLAAGLRAPSAGNTQACAFVAVTDPATRGRVAEVCGEREALARGLPRWISSAPVLVVPCVRPGAYAERYAEADKRASAAPGDRDVPWWWVDAGQSLVLLLTAAVDEELAAGLLDVHDRDALRDVLGIPPGVVPLGVVTVGHPAPDRPSGSLARGRRPIAEVLHHDRWGRPWPGPRAP